MLGEKAKPNKIESLMKGQPFYVETKYDGERFQLHKSGNKYGFYSRNSKDYTDIFGCDATSGTLAPHIHDCFNAGVQHLILDGEMCGWNSEENMFMTCSKTQVDIKSRYTGSIYPCYCVFDILLYNDVVLTNKPLKERLEYLNKALREKEDRIVLATRQTFTKNQQVVDELNKAIDNRLEGIVVKDPLMVYKPNIRSGSGWFKVKPEYMLGLNDDLGLSQNYLFFKLILE